MKEQDILKKIVDYFTTNIFNQHNNASLDRNSKLNSYKINPIVVKYLSKLLENNYTVSGVAKALYLPRVLGTSINTIFGTRIQRMFVELELAEGSMIAGMDIEFIDKRDERKKWCQLKSGPNTINSEDVKPLIDKFKRTINLARTNSALKGVNNNDFIVGVLYGQPEELSTHYKKIDEYHPVIIGKDFWYRLTGFPNFYDKLVKELHENIMKLDTQNLLNKGLANLEEEVRNSPHFNF